MKYAVILLLISLSVSVQATDHRTYYQNYYQGYSQNYSYQNGYYPTNAYPQQNAAGGHQAQHPYAQPSSYQAAPGTNTYAAQAYRSRYNSYYNLHSNSGYYQRAYPQRYYSYPDSTAPEKNSSKKTIKTISITTPSTGKKVVIKPPQEKITLHKKQVSRKKPSNKVSSTKEQFFEQIPPLVLNENIRINKNRKHLLTMLDVLQNGQPLSPDASQWMKQLARQYRIKGDILKQADLQQELVKRVGPIAPSMALAQAANESAWGTSRFSKLGNNLFGIWTYNPNIGIKPLNREPGKKHFVRKFSSFQDSVSVYIHTLNTHSAYKKLRDIRQKAFLEGREPTGHDLANGLEKYSAKGRDYIQMIQSMINKNNLDSITLINLAYK